MWSQGCELASQILWGPSDKCREFSRLGRSCCSDFGGTVGPEQGIMGEAGVLEAPTRVWHRYLMHALVQ